MTMHTQATDAAPEAVEYRGKVRARDRETSWEAASAQTNTKTAALQILIYRELLRDPKTDEELLISLGRLQPVSPSGIRTRRHELELAGWVRECVRNEGTIAKPIMLPVKRRTLNGGPSTVWRAVLDDEPAPPAPAPAPAPAAKPKAAKLYHERGIKVARKLSQWEIGDPSWADLLISAYLDPDAAEARLREEVDE
jgi:hypothetical protein